MDRAYDDPRGALPATVGVATAHPLVGIGRDAAYAAIRHDQWPTRVIRVGGAIRIPVIDLVDLVGEDAVRRALAHEVAS